MSTIPTEPTLKLYPGPAWSARSSKPLQPLLWFGVIVSFLWPFALFCDYDVAVWFWEDRMPGTFTRRLRYPSCLLTASESS
ncbi:MAG: hypothetical protein R3C05_20460 [Pirellulaceae bacterium]